MARAFSETLAGVLSGGFSKPPAPVAALPTNGLAHRCLFRARELSDSTILIAAIGEIDETNSTELVDYVQTTFNRYRQIVLDLSRVDFFDESGYSCIETLNTRCSHRGISLVVVPSPDVQRALEDHAPDCTVATAANIVSAVATLARTGRSRLWLARKSGQ
ncbi:MAG: STAS domain-containing protein [Mycobacterium sp.]